MQPGFNSRRNMSSSIKIVRVYHPCLVALEAGGFCWQKYIVWKTAREPRTNASHSRVFASLPAQDETRDRHLTYLKASDALRSIYNRFLPTYEQKLARFKEASIKMGCVRVSRQLVSLHIPAPWVSF
jgi:hypothetical protein